MTLSADHAAGQTAIRVAPRGGRVSIGLILDGDGVSVVQSRQGTDAIERAAFVRYPSGLGAALDDKARFACNVIRSIAEKPSDCDVWVGLNASDVYVLTLPIVKDADLDVVALLNASRVIPINPEETSFDYRILGRTPGGEVPSQRSVAVSASQAACEAWQAAFAEAGIELSGLTSACLASGLLCSRQTARGDWGTYGFLTLDAGESALTIIDKGVVALQRTFNFGMDQLLADAVDRLSVTEEADPAESVEARRARLAVQVKSIFADGSVSQAYGDLLEASLDGAVDRAVKYLERTFNYFERVEHGSPLQGLYVTADHGVVQVLVKSLEQKLGIACECRLVDSLTLEDARDQVAAVRRQFKSVALYAAAGLACSDERTPNLLDLPADRRRRAGMRRLVRAATAVLGVCTAAMLGFGIWCGLAWLEDGRALLERQQQLEAIGKPLTAEDVEKEMKRLESLEVKGVGVLERRRFAGLLGELAAVRGTEVYIRSVELVPGGEAGGVAKTKASARAGEKAEAKPQTLVVVRVSLYGSAQEREAAFAEFINRLERLNRGGTMTVVTEESQDNGVAYAVRMNGDF